jgi:hypothetical protein
LSHLSKKGMFMTGLSVGCDRQSYAFPTCEHNVACGS